MPTRRRSWPELEPLPRWQAAERPGSRPQIPAGLEASRIIPRPQIRTVGSLYAPEGDGSEPRRHSCPARIMKQLAAKRLALFLERLPPARRRAIEAAQRKREHDGKVRLSSDTIGHWAELFDLFDEDASGALSKKELECLFDVVGVDRAWVEDRIKAWDFDHDGTLDFAEFMLVCCELIDKPERSALGRLRATEVFEESKRVMLRRNSVLELEHVTNTLKQVLEMKEDDFFEKLAEEGDGIRGITRQQRDRQILKKLCWTLLEVSDDLTAWRITNVQVSNDYKQIQKKLAALAKNIADYVTSNKEEALKLETNAKKQEARVVEARKLVEDARNRLAAIQSIQHAEENFEREQVAELEKQVRDSEDLLRENDDLAQMMLDRAQEQDMEYKELQSFAPTYLADLQRLEAAKWKCAVLRHLTAKCLDYTDVHGGKDGPLADMLQGSEALDAALAGLQASHDKFVGKTTALQSSALSAISSASPTARGGLARALSSKLGKSMAATAKKPDVLPTTSE